MEDITVRVLTQKDWFLVSAIYEAGIATQNATFQTEAPTWEDWDKAHRKDNRLVAVHNEKVIGWAALSPVSARPVYAGVTEVSIYIDPDFRGKGVGDILMNSLIRETENSGIWTLQSGVFPENKASIKLHLKHGFRQLGTKEHIGKMNGTWRDVVMLERRSKTVGID